MKLQIPKYEATFKQFLKEVFSSDMLWDWRIVIPKEEKKQLFVSVWIMDRRKEITRNPEAYSQSNREMLRFIRNIIAHQTDHKFKTYITKSTVGSQDFPILESCQSDNLQH